MAPAPFLLTTANITVDIRLIKWCRVTVRPRNRFWSLDRSVWRRRDLTQSISYLVGSSFTSALFPVTAWFHKFRCPFISAFSREHFSTLFLKKPSTGTSTARRSLVQVAMSSVKRGSATRFETALFTVLLKAELWNHWTTDRITTVTTNAKKLVSVPDFVACSVSARSPTTVFYYGLATRELVTPCILQPNWADMIGLDLRGGAFSRHGPVSEAVKSVLALRSRDRCGHFLYCILYRLTFIWRNSDECCDTRRGCSSTAVAEYAFRVTGKGNVCNALALVGFHYPRIFKTEKLEEN